MSTFQQIAVGVIGVAMATTLVLPKRQTPDVVKNLFGGFRGVLATSMGTGKDV